MLVKLLRVFTWLAVIYAVEENVAMILGAFSTTETPWSHIAGWFNPLIFDNWRLRGGSSPPRLPRTTWRGGSRPAARSQGRNPGLGALILS